MNQSATTIELSNLFLNNDNLFKNQVKDSSWGEECRCIHGDLADGFCDEFYFNGFHIRYFKLSIPENIEFPFKNETDNIQLKFVLTGNLTLKELGGKQINLKLNSNQHNIVYLNKSGYRINCGGNDFQFFSIAIEPKLFEKYLHFNNPVLEEFKNKISNGSASLICDHNCPIRFKMFQIIDDIIDCNKEGVLKKMFYEAKIIELLMLQFEQIFMCDFTSNSVKRDDFKKIFELRAYLQGNLDKNITLKELSRVVGTNESTLKKGFKEVFGKTIFSYWSDLKMDRAVKLLLEGEMNISEIAFALGFKYPQHFSTAFKRKYGVTPSKYR